MERSQVGLEPSSKPTYENGAAKVLEVLEAEGYVENIERAWNGGTYTYPTPTEKGWSDWRRGGSFRVMVRARWR